jgi:hypothetical protein
MSLLLFFARSSYPYYVGTQRKELGYRVYHFLQMSHSPPSESPHFFSQQRPEGKVILPQAVEEQQLLGKK